jgi:phosphomannomutase/phosphoglucomutase
MTIPPAIFREYDVRGVADRDLTAEGVHCIARAVGTLVREAGGRSVVLGRDVRTTSERFARAAAEGLASTGVDVVDLGLVPTPVASFAAATLPVDGLCVVTASHNPPEYNGLKVAVRGETLHGDGVQALRRVCEAGRFARGAGAVRSHDGVTPYGRRFRESLRLGPRRLRVVADAGNGAGGFVAMPLFHALGLDLVPLFAEPDGTFPNHPADPSDPANLEALRARVRETGADLGVAWDGDADRVAAVDERGEILWGDLLLLLFARALLAEHPGATVVAEVKCSMALYEDVARRGGRAVMSKAGHSIVRARMKAEGALLAGEMSGHVFFADRWPGFDDGLYAAARLVELVSHGDAPLSALLADVPRTFATPELRRPCPDDRKAEVVRRAQAWFGARHDTVTVDGVRIAFPGGWGLVRASGTQPLLVLRFEATSEARLSEIRAYVTERLEAIMREAGV